MYEAILLAVLVALVILALRCKKTVILDNPIIIHKVGVYHATLAPQLARSQLFLEAIVSKFAEPGLQADDIAMPYFEVRDSAIAGPYLLAVGFSAGMLYFQVIMLPANAAGSRYDAISRFSAQVMVHHPVSTDTRDAARLFAAVEQAAKQFQITCQSLNPES